jgi:hypothetical protein
MRFSLKYEGELKSTTDRNTRVKHKNRLRWHFSDQLDELMMRGDFTRMPRHESDVVKPIDDKGFRIHSTKISGQDFEQVWYIPVIDRTLNISCSLHVRIDRPERPGSLFERGGENGGDLDNRIKTLLDALRVPHNVNEARRSETRPDLNFCVCLFDDDSMVTSLYIETRPSLRPLPRGHVELTIDVEIRAHDLTFDPE